MNMKQEIELRHLRYFLAVAETLHFSKAAAQLGMAQPPLSQQIRSLERILGYPLFGRTTCGVRLTKVGQYFREHARNTLTKIHEDRCILAAKESFVVSFKITSRERRTESLPTRVTPL